MKKFTAPIDIVANDKASKQVNQINKSFNKMSANVAKDSAIAGNSFNRFTQTVSLRSKQALVSANNLNASMNRVFRNISKKLGSFGLFVGFSSLILGVKNVINKFADFEQANAGLASVMINATEPELKALANDAKRLGAITARSATEVVGLQEAYARLGFAQSDVLNMTESTIAGSVAMRGELGATAELVGAMVKSFDKFESVNAPEIIDQLTASTQQSALNFEKLQTALPIVAGAANAAKVSFTKLLSELGKTSDAGIDASSSATALRNIYLEAAKQGIPYEKLLQKVAGSTDMLKTANDLFGKRAAVVAVTLAKNLELVDQLDTSLQNAGGTAQKAADIQLNTLQGTLTILKSAWEGWILSLDDGNGKFSTFLKTSVKVATEVLSLATGTAKAKKELNETELRIRSIANKVNIFLKTLKLLTIAFIAFKAVLIASRIAIAAYNIALGITSGLYGAMTKGIATNTIALNAYKVASGLATAAQWLLNTAFYGFPLVWILAAFAAVVAGVVYLVKNWDDMAAKLDSDWKRITTTFKKEGLGGLFKQWGKDLAIYLLEPLQNLLAIMYKVTGAKGWEELFESVTQTRNKLLREVGRGDEAIITKHQLRAGSVPIGMSNEQALLKGAIEGKSFAGIETKEDKLTRAIDNNTKELEKNTDAQFGDWKGKFITSILRDANITEGNIVQRELATSVINNETNIISAQKEAIETPVGNTQRRQPTQNWQGTLYIVDKTGGQYGFEFEGTGINVVTTGNE